MAIEIERKFLVAFEHLGQHISLDHFSFSHLVQGYLASSERAVIRVRIDDHQGFLTIKQRASGMTRLEIERTLTLEEARELLNLCEGKVIEKKRYAILHGRHQIDLDVFLGENKGLCVAEVEFANEDAANAFEPPIWFSTEVTTDKRYYNHYLSQYPYSTW